MIGWFACEFEGQLTFFLYRDASYERRDLLLSHKWTEELACLIQDVACACGTTRVKGKVVCSKGTWAEKLHRRLEFVSSLIGIETNEVCLEIHNKEGSAVRISHLFHNPALEMRASSRRLEDQIRQHLISKLGNPQSFESLETFVNFFALNSLIGPEDVAHLVRSGEIPEDKSDELRQALEQLRSIFDSRLISRLPGNWGQSRCD